jgi:hypothetical protein
MIIPKVVTSFLFVPSEDIEYTACEITGMYLNLGKNISPGAMLGGIGPVGSFLHEIKNTDKTVKIKKKVI